MELIIVGPVLLVMAGLLLYITHGGRLTPEQAITPWPGVSLMAAGHEAQPATPALSAPDAKHLSQTDLLLADILTELLQLKEEVGELRSRIDLLNQDLQALSLGVDPGRSRQAA